LFDELPLAERLEIDIAWKPGTDERCFDAPEAARMIGACDLFISIVPWHSPAVDSLLERVAPDRSAGMSGEFDITIAAGTRKHTARAAFEGARLVMPDASFETYAEPPIYPARAVAFARRLREKLPAHAEVLAVHADTKP